MILGHLGIALGARAVKRDAPLGWLIAASFAPDVMDLAFASAGFCNAAGAYSHSLPAIGVTALVLGVGAAWRTRSGKTALLVAGLVVVHLLVDYLTGLKALWPGGPVVGLDLYRWGWADFALEAPCIVGGWWAARRWGDLPRWVGGRLVLVALLGVQLVADTVHKEDRIKRPMACAKEGLFHKAPLQPAR